MKKVGKIVDGNTRYYAIVNHADDPPYHMMRKFQENIFHINENLIHITYHITITQTNTRMQKKEEKKIVPS